MPKADKRVARKKKRERAKVIRRRGAESERRRLRTGPLEDAWQGEEFLKGKDLNERLAKVSITKVLARFRRDNPSMVEDLRPLVSHLGRPPGGRIRKRLTTALTLAAWAEYADLPHFAPMVVISPQKDIRVGHVATEQHAIGDGMCARYDDYNPVLYLGKTGKVGSLSYRDGALDELVSFLRVSDAKTSALVLDATHGDSIRQEAILDGDILGTLDKKATTTAEAKVAGSLSEAADKLGKAIDELESMDGQESAVLDAKSAAESLSLDADAASKALERVQKTIAGLEGAEAAAALLEQAEEAIDEADDARQTTPSVALWLNTGCIDEDGGRVYAKAGYFPLFMHEEKAFVVAETFLPCGFAGTPEHGTPGMEAMADRSTATLPELVKVYGSQETVMALTERGLEPLLVAREGRGQQPTFVPLRDFVYGTEERLSTGDSAE